jgi:amidase
VPTTGVIPIARSQDVVGPMARTVRDAALLLAAMTGRPDAAALDPAQSEVDRWPLRGVRLGLPRAGLWTSDQRISGVVDEAVALLASLGATIVDPVEIPSVGQIGEADEQTVLDHELKTGLAEYFATRPAGGPKSLADLIAFNLSFADIELARFDQDIFERAECTHGLDAPAYLTALERCRQLSRTDGLDAALAAHDLDALVMPSTDLPFDLERTDDDPDQGADYIGDRIVGPTTLPAMAGYPMLTVPCGLVDGLPVGLGVVGLADRERVLLRIGHAYEIAAFGPAGSAAAFPPNDDVVG